MAEKKQESGFTVTDRRLFTEDGELRKDVPEEQEAPKAPAAPTAVKETAPAENTVRGISGRGRWNVGPRCTSAADGC